MLLPHSENACIQKNIKLLEKVEELNGHNMDQNHTLFCFVFTYLIDKMNIPQIDTSYISSKLIDIFIHT